MTALPHFELPDQTLHLPGADLRYQTHWIDIAGADALFATLRDGIAWERHRIKLFGREIEAPRLSCWIGDPEAVYTYSRMRHEPRPWPAALRPLRERLRAETGTDFNGVLANLYRDGHDSMGWHADDERELGKRPLIASVSLGVSRRFLIRHREQTSRRLSIDLAPGSLLLMGGDTQQNYRHALPKTARATGMRINLTFRRLIKDAIPRESGEPGGCMTWSP
jgi:alkylated DNA repair dioxygenase AlkB